MSTFAHLPNEFKAAMMDLYAGRLYQRLRKAS